MKAVTTIETWHLKTPFRISRRECTHVDTLMVSVSDGPHTGRGEAAGLNYKGETVATMKRDIEAFFNEPSHEITRHSLLQLMPANGARCAIDCALWDLEAKKNDTSLLSNLNAAPDTTLTTAFTLSLDTPAKMASAAKKASNQPILKLKLGNREAVNCVQAVRAARLDASIIVDANEALSFDDLRTVAPILADADVSLIEQPLARADDEALIGYKSPVPLCADESCMTRADLPNLIGRYDAINIKLEKCGGLTEALLLMQEAQKHNLTLMVGCMLGTSLAMLPAVKIAEYCKFIDLDGPLLLAEDRPYGISYINGKMSNFDTRLWG